MKLLAFFTASLLVGLASTAPTSNVPESSDKVTVTKEFFPEDLVIHTAEHEVVNILVPLNALNFEDDTDGDDNEDADSTIFFTLADTENGQRVDKGFYIRKGGVVTKLLDNGREAAAANDETKTVYIGAKDGLYAYNAEGNKADKYGSVTDSIISIAKINGSDALYILTEDHFIYKVTEQGTKKEKVDNVVNAQQIVLDYENNLYYYTSDKSVYVLTADGVKKIEGLPEHASYVNVLKPPFILDNGIPVVVDSKSYIAYPNGTSSITDFEFEARPTAWSMEATLIQYYAYEKKIYEYNIVNLMVGELLGEVKEYLEDKTDDISAIATRSRDDLRP